MTVFLFVYILLMTFSPASMIDLTPEEPTGKIPHRTLTAADSGGGPVPKLCPPHCSGQN